MWPGAGLFSRLRMVVGMTDTTITDEPPSFADSFETFSEAIETPVGRRAARRANKARARADKKRAKAEDTLAKTGSPVQPGVVPVPVAAAIILNPYTLWNIGDQRKKFSMSVKAKTVWLSTLAQQVNVGLTPQTALANLGQDADLTRRRLGVNEASALADEMISRGLDFADALEVTGVLDNAAITAIRAGYLAGRLGEALTQSAQRLDRVYKMRSQIRSAMMMPIITLVAAFAIAWYVITHIVPVLGGVFTSLGHNLPPLTRSMIWLSHAVNTLILIALIALLACAMAYRYLRRSEARRIRIDRAKLRTPLVGAMLLDSGLATAMQTLSLLLSSGITTTESLRAAAGATGNAALRDVIMRSAESAEAYGTKLSVFFAAEDLISTIDVSLIQSGEESGAVFDGVARAADFHFRAADERTAQLTDSIKPALTVIVGVIVGLIAGAIYLPMFQMYGLLSQAG
jgi:type IV pilus assembly protein PilC